MVWDGGSPREVKLNCKIESRNLREPRCCFQYGLVRRKQGDCKGLGNVIRKPELLNGPEWTRGHEAFHNCRMEKWVLYAGRRETDSLMLWHRLVRRWDWVGSNTILRRVGGKGGPMG